MSYVELKSVIKRYGETEIIHGIDLGIEKEEFTVFVGPSGCGKSTLLRMIAGLESLQEGSIHIGGKRVDTLRSAERGIAMVFQNYALYPHMTVFENMAFGLRIAKAGQDEIRAKVQRAAGILQISEILGRQPRALSGGQRQRVAIGRAIVREPKVFLFDEPLSNLDAKLRVQMRVELTRLHRDLRATMIYVTHDQVEAMTMADKIVVLNQGRVEQVGRPLDLYNAPCNRFVAGFIGSPAMNFLEGVIAGAAANSVTVALGGDKTVTVPCRPGQAREGAPVTLGIRPEALEVAGQGDATVTGRVLAVERLGNETFVYVDVPGSSDFAVHVAGDVRIAPDEAMSFGLPAARCHLFDADGRAFEMLAA
ncbi:sn-glycerol-3-phosphate ABC transporter ATP-binding protein UgpC [Mesorhizobium sp. AR07]|uniref:ABC transporter ATP-binding protein n=1 Tax=Mesorhizobium sp. AR07 TaxID=2865838 RepID=UPI00215EB273|nr:sn-glycerol-3-phosphate ABC transporter ATP-binding protein UgpC [Mesorhizobium sp. AR07]UVK43864.1 sn-glycerol-3-phosphate ABC transporter ATP-binding protein UgpC [Mesorhizobium sp. AR07]